jgi:peptidoglycan/xylan/chitin deacetylase (PgdA/CDA1 family)
MPAQHEKKKVPILMYHSISQPSNPKFKQFIVPPVLFADQMAYLHQHAYTPITVTQLIKARAQGRSALPEQPVVLTFDDGFADFFTEALPVLQHYGFVATLYVATAYINGMSRWLRREGEAAHPMLTWDQLTEINAYGIECGSHTHWHPQLDTLPITRARDEIVQCKKLLEGHLGQEVTSFAYPYGYHTAAIKRLVREAGYTSACAVKYEMSSNTTDPFALARFLVSADTGVDALAALLNKDFPPFIAGMFKRPSTSVWRLIRCCSASLRSIHQAGLLDDGKRNRNAPAAGGEGFHV